MNSAQEQLSSVNGSVPPDPEILLIPTQWSLDQQHLTWAALDEATSSTSIEESALLPRPAVARVMAFLGFPCIPFSPTRPLMESNVLIADQLQSYFGLVRRVHPLDVQILPNREEPMAYRIAHPAYAGKWSVELSRNRIKSASATAHFKGNIGLVNMEGKSWMLYLPDPTLSDKPEGEASNGLWAMSGDRGYLSNGSESVSNVVVLWLAGDCFKVKYDRCLPLPLQDENTSQKCVLNFKKKWTYKASVAPLGRYGAVNTTMASATTSQSEANVAEMQHEELGAVQDPGRGL